MTSLSLQQWARAVIGGFTLTLLGWFWHSLPEPLFDSPTSVVIEDRDGTLLGGKIAADQQWRFPYREEVPEKFRQLIVVFEDRRFYSHFGVDVLAIGRAFLQNLRAGRVVSGGSTITMQTIRLSRMGQARTLSEKVLEAVLAFRLELSFDKDGILALYAANAPFGGNVVGLEAASWRYFGRAPQRLSWAEMATLAVLPNNPALVHPGRNRDQLLEKRNRLLTKLYESGKIDSLTCVLAMREGLPPRPRPLPSDAPHLLDRVAAETPGAEDGRRVRTTLDRHLQLQATKVVERHHRRYRDNGINNAAAIIIDNDSRAVLAYIGNVGDRKNRENGAAVDVITAPRSTGSILKPFLYAAAIDKGEIYPQQLIADIPTRFGGFQPENFNQRYEGAVRADQALARSLNVPAARLLKTYGVARFHDDLGKLGMKTLRRGPSHYGLSLILGGAEARLWDIAGMYAGMAATLNHYDQSHQPYRADDFREPTFILDAMHNHQGAKAAGPPVFRAASIWHSLEAIRKVKRPESAGAWEEFLSSYPVAWKTGTSYGFRDAWAIGCTSEYTVGVWVGNADGEGRPDLTGITAAAPILFELLGLLSPKQEWFGEPLPEMNLVEICPESGHRASDFCERTELQLIGQTASRAKPCPYHRLVHIDKTESFQVTSRCVPDGELITRSWFVLPPAMEWYYKTHQMRYQSLPPYHPDCGQSYPTADQRSMELIYPSRGTKIFVPVELDGSLGQTVFEVAHRRPGQKVFWHLNDEYLGETRYFHQLAAHPSPGTHKLLLVDEAGERLETTFEVMPRN